MRRINFQGSPLTLVGRILKEGVQASEFRMVSGEMKESRLGDFAGKIKVITVFPSLDTPVCDLQVKEFNKRASGLSQDTVILGISKDLPFAQKRFCETFNIKNVAVFSDYRYSSFGINFGLLIKELNLLARAALILDKNNVVRYMQIAPEITSSLNYDDIINNISSVVSNPGLPITGGELAGHCKPCEAGTPSLSKEKIDRLIAQSRGWELVEDKKIVKEFKFKDFVEAKYFFDLIAVIAEEQGHHPTFTSIYNKLKITLTTHAAAGLTDNDFIMAKIIDEVQV